MSVSPSLAPCVARVTLRNDRVSRALYECIWTVLFYILVVYYFKLSLQSLGRTGARVGIRVDRGEKSSCITLRLGVVEIGSNVWLLIVVTG